MNLKNLKRPAASGLGVAAGLAGAGALAYAAHIGTTWLRYGHPPAPGPEDADALLDVFMPVYDVAERHHVGVGASADVTFAALMEMDLEKSGLIRAVFKAREIVLGAEPGAKTEARSLVDVTRELGWVVLAEVPGHEIVMGAVTRPWQANVVFRGVPSEHFAAFNEPDYVKIAWTLRADAISPFSSMARSETRVVATDRGARRKFRWYWARFSAGIRVIREIALRLVKKEAERRAAQGQTVVGSSTAITVPPVGGTSM